jgi:hypothetical protein
MRKFALVLPLALAACTAQPATTAASPKPTVSPIGTTGPATASCPATASAGPDERQASGRGVEMWALLFPTEAEIHAKKQLKVVIRITGGMGNVAIAVGPDGQQIAPVWGPEYHGGSNFEHPGAEFGTGWEFPTAGCWTLRVVNEAGTGELTLRIAP